VVNENPAKPALREFEVKLARDEASRSAEMVQCLPEAIFAQDDISQLMQLAAMELFFAHARTLIEFLLVRPASDRSDWNARDTLGSDSTWSPDIDSLLKRKLIASWTLASQHVMHFSNGRAVSLPQGQADLKEIADEVLLVWDQFAEASNHPDVPHCADFSTFRPVTDGSAAYRAARHNRRLRLRGGFRCLLHGAKRLTRTAG